MSVTVDANVLIYAANTEDPVHRPARALLDRLAQGPELFVLFWPTIMGFLRIATSPSIFEDPYTQDEVLTMVADLLDRPHVRTPSEQSDFLDLYRLTAPMGTRGKLVPDAHIATLMRQHGVGVIYSRDRDFRRFDGIEARDPFA